MPLHSNSKAEHPTIPEIETALATLSVRAGGLERLVSIAFSAGKHAEVSYNEWLDNTVQTTYRIHKANAKKRRKTQKEMEG